MKKKLLFFSILATAVAVIMISCSKDDDDNGIPDYVVGTWTMDGYYKGDDTHTIWYTFDEDGIQETTVTLQRNGMCSGTGILFNGDAEFTVKTGNKWNDGYWAIINFYKAGKIVSTATLTSYDNDRLTGYVKIDGYDQKLFIFRKK